MHIEIGIIDPVRVMCANAAALALVATQAKAVIKEPVIIVKTILTAIVFSVLMESWHLPIGPSELHLIGATTVYLLFGFRATLLGFGLGLMLQTIFEPQDLYHIGVNSLSLMLPLILMHQTFGKKLSALKTAEKFNFARVIRLDAVYYAGVSAMVLFWLLISKEPLPFAEWARWALYYMPVFFIEASITYLVVSMVSKYKDIDLIKNIFEINKLNLAK